ncbi:MAG: integrase core domain-containing protein [Chloroflexota bacterium]|nr:integrase core domain-containing protein [Chloroflexota bacterium]
MVVGCVGGGVEKTRSFDNQSTGEGDIRIFKPETVIGWHRELVRRKWKQKPVDAGGRPPIGKELSELIVRLAKENTRWGYGKIAGELQKLGYDVSESTVRNVLKAHDILPAPVRFGSIGWRKLMGHYKYQLLACDFFTVETIRMQTLYVLFFIELGTRRVYLAGVTEHPDGVWVAQQATSRTACWRRNTVWLLDEREAESDLRCLIRDNDKKFTMSFDAVFESEGVKILRTPYQAPNANSHAERWVRTARDECLDHILILNEAHLRRTLNEFSAYYNTRRPHQGLDQQSPVARTPPEDTGPVACRQVLGGIIHDYYRAPNNLATQSV